jgi:hypothetical protein
MITSKVNHSVFADEVRVYQTNTTDDFNNELKIEMVSQGSESILNRVDFKKSKNIKLIDTLSKIFSCVLKDYINELYEDTLLDNFEIYQDWSINVSYNGKAVYNHTHNECFATITYYPQDTDNLEEHIFNKHYFEVRSGQLIISNSNGKAVWDRYAKGDRGKYLRITPKKGQAVIFQGHMPHFVVPSEINPRYCVTSFITLKSKHSTLTKIK